MIDVTFTTGQARITESFATSADAHAAAEAFVTDRRRTWHRMPAVSGNVHYENTYRCVRAIVHETPQAAAAYRDPNCQQFVYIVRSYEDRGLKGVYRLRKHAEQDIRDRVSEMTDEPEGSEEWQLFAEDYDIVEALVE
jgi:hypothetical protein